MASLDVDSNAAGDKVPGTPGQRANGGCVVVIPARGGSKGLPRKNLRLLSGIPLVAHAIRAARAATKVTRVLVSTEDPEIAEVAVRWGAEVAKRPLALSGDTVSSEAVLLSVLDTLEQQGEPMPELVALLQCTAPLTTSEDIDQTIAHLQATGADSCFSAVPFFHFLWGTAADGTARGINHSGVKRQRRQDWSGQYLENGAIYVMRTAVFRPVGDRFCGQVTLCELPSQRAMEIDDASDLGMAQVLLSERDANQRRQALPNSPAAIVFDFDGVMTDDRVLVGQDGAESVMCSRADGYAIGLLRRIPVRLLVLSRETNPVVSARASKLGLETIQGADDKWQALDGWLQRQGLGASDVIYVGNDEADLGCMRRVGCPVCPADAHPRVRRAARIVLERSGGYGAVRELAELLLAALGGPGAGDL